MQRLLVTLMLALVVAAGAASTAEARVAVGVGEQDYAPFADSSWKGLGLRKSRIVIPWNVATKRGPTRGKMDSYYKLARQTGVELLVAFNPPNNARCPRRPCSRPSSRSYRRAFRSFRKRYPKLKVFAPWNEANHISQPTFSTNKGAKAAAAYYNIVRANCRRCKVIAADVIDESNMVRWLRTFRRFAKRPRIWGLHNYRDTNYFHGPKTGGTRRLLRTVRRGQVWLTETGGIVTFITPSGGTLFPTSESRANRATQRMFSLAKKYRRRIARLYIYHWRQPLTDNRFDAGLLRKDGTARPAFDTVQNTLNGPQKKYFGR
jgi:hypothetical protein